MNLYYPGYAATPLGWALHSCLVARSRPEGQFARVITALLDAGASAAGANYPTGGAVLDDLLRRYM